MRYIIGNRLEKSLSTSKADLEQWAQQRCRDHLHDWNISWDGRFASFFVNLKIKKWANVDLKMEINLDLDIGDAKIPVLSIVSKNQKTAICLSVDERFEEFTAAALKEDIMIWKLKQEK
ncbi:MAG: hypothetical protein ABJH63_15375 [Rhizobiaceae bacterium]